METNDIGENNLQIQDPQPDDDYYSETKLSDVIEVIGEDMYQNNPLVIGGIANSIEGGIIDPEQQQQQTTAYNGSHAIPQQSQPQPQQPQQQALQQPQIPEQVQQPQTQPAPQNSRGRRGNAFVKVIEQPATKALRFRYECEGRSAGSIPGVNYTSENKTYPTIEVAGYRGRAVVVVSCVTKDPPYKPHPHNLVGKEGCKRGVCTLEINSETMRAVFNHLGIQCVKKKDIESALRVREEIRVDPFKTGFAHRYQPSSIDLNSVRLCFQVFLESEQRGRFTVPLAPVVSDPIYDKKAMSDLVICGLCSCSSTVAGGKDIILLCEKVAKEDISVRFFEEQNGRVIWEGFGDFAHTDVHKQTAIKFKTPRYRSLDVDQPVKVFIQLRRPSDGATSEALQFDYLPLDSDTVELKRKRQKTNPDPNMHLIRHYQAQERQQRQTPQDHHDGRLQAAMQPPMDYLSVAPNTAIKTEPRDTSPIPYMYGNNYRLPDQSPSPQPSLSPLNVYNNHSNTPSPYGAGQQNNILISPNNQYIGGTAVGVGGSISPNILDMGDYGNYQQQPQYQQQWTNNIKHTLTPNNNLSSNNFNVNNLLMTTTVPLSSAATNNNQQQSQSPWHLPSCSTTTNPNNNSINNNNNNNNGNSYNVNQLITNNNSNNNISNNNTHHHQQTVNNNMNMQSEVPTLSSLLEMDSEQLMHLNSAELSGLSIS